MSKIMQVFGALLCIAIAHRVSANSVSTDQVECPQICPAVFSPVCGTNGKVFKEFSNSCVMGASNCRLQRSAMKPYKAADAAWCSSTLVENLSEKFENLDFTKPECMKPCTMIYAPVCVSNGEYRATLSHKCQMDLFNCALGGDASQQFRALKQGAC